MFIAPRSLGLQQIGEDKLAFVGSTTAIATRICSDFTSQFVSGFTMDHRLTCDADANNFDVTESKEC